MKPQNETKLLILSILIPGSLVGIGLWWLISNYGNILNNLSLPNKDKPASVFTPERISLGNKILVTADTNPYKQAGVQAFAKGDFATAYSKFEASLQANRNDPEALIYYNTAKV